MCRSFPLGLFTQHLFQGKWKAWELWEPLMQGKKLFTRHKIASKYWICHPLYPVMVWVSRALFNSRFWVLALPKSGVVVVLSSNTSIGVKVVLDFFFLGGVCGICRRSSDHVRVWDAGDLITPFLMYRICHPA